MEGYNFRHQLNPAFAPENNYVSIPALGNFGVGAASNIGVNTFIYKKPDGQLTTFMNSSVSSDEFLNKLHKNNHLTANINMTLLSCGFRAFNGYNTVTISTRAELGANLPKDLFTFMKVGMTGPSTSYNFENVRVRANAYAELALGHQRKITNELSAGAKVKFLFGLGHLDARINTMDVHMSDNLWSVRAKGEMNIAAGSGLYVPTNKESGKDLDKPDMYNQIDYDGIEYNNFGLAGFGLGFDLGATYDMHQFVEGLTLSAALTDIGFISWNNNHKAVTPATQWTFNGFSNIALDSDQPDYEQNKLDEQFDNIFDDLKDCTNFERVSDGGSSRTTALATTLAIGAEYQMPFYKGLTGGFLFSQRMGGCFSWTEGRFYANVKPTDWFDCSINYGAGSFGSSFGWLVNFHPKGFTFFIGSDHQFFNITPQFAPVGKANANLTLGMSVNFGAKTKR
ncbi:MAG: hypothetical protein HDS68_04340 [Bacteroidales bacterium]|nr:hypothetical protein [Bacteroidales bacterium]